MKFIVVGAGYAGAIAARFIAENFDEKVTLIEKRDRRRLAICLIT